MNKETRKIVASIFDSSQNWQCDNYTLWNEEIGIELWMANGLFLFEPYNNIVYKNRSRIQINFSLIDKIVLYPKAKKLMNKIIANKIASILT